jgi:hypothetical protein
MIDYNVLDWNSYDWLRKIIDISCMYSHNLQIDVSQNGPVNALGH